MKQKGVFRCTCVTTGQPCLRHPEPTDHLLWDGKQTPPSSVKDVSSAAGWVRECSKHNPAILGCFRYVKMGQHDSLLFCRFRPSGNVYHAPILSEWTCYCNYWFVRLRSACFAFSCNRIKCKVQTQSRLPAWCPFGMVLILCLPVISVWLLGRANIAKAFGHY